MNRGEFLQKLIEDKGHSIMSLSRTSGVAYTTIRSMIERNLVNASIDSVLKICKVLGINVEELNNPDAEVEIETIAAHHDGEDWTEEELEEIKQFKEFVRMKRGKKGGE